MSDGLEIGTEGATPNPESGGEAPAGPPSDPVELMKWDPFAKSADGADKGQAQKTLDAPSPAPTAPPAAVSKPPQADPVAQAQLAQIQNLIMQQGQPAQAPEQPQRYEAPEYKWQVPQEMVAALTSGDPQQTGAALNALVNGMARTMHQAAIMEVGRAVQHILSAFPQMITEHTAAGTIEKTFYGEVATDLNNPVLRPTVEKVARALSHQKSTLGIPHDVGSREFMQEVADTARQILGIQPPAAPRPQARARGRFVADPGVRAQVPAAEGQSNLGELLGI